MRKWRRIYAHDTSFRPPPAAVLRHALKALAPYCLWLEALSREAGFPSSGLDIPVATAAVRPDPADPSHAYLTLLHFVNDRTTLQTLFEALAEEVYSHGIRTLTGPTHLLPFLGGGALSSHWHLPTALDTPYQPPYTPEHLSALMTPLETSTLFHVETSLTHKPVPDVMVKQLKPHRLATDLLPLLQSVAAPYPPTEIEAKAMLRWLAPYAPFGVWASLPSEPDVPAGFVLLYGDHHLPNSFRRKTPRSGRLWGGVQPGARRQGLGRALREAGLHAALERSWQSVSIGPISEQRDAASFLRACGGVPQQRYTLYRTNF